jgi:hypothetical protein
VFGPFLAGVEVEGALELVPGDDPLAAAGLGLQREVEPVDALGGLPPVHLDREVDFLAGVDRRLREDRVDGRRTDTDAREQPLHTLHSSGGE